MQTADNRGIFSLFVLALLPILQAQDNVQVKPDIVYATYGTRQLELDVYRPSSGETMPGILVIRGGGWRVGDKQGFAPIARNLAAKGFVTACIEYCVLPDVQFPDPVYDTKAAVRWMRAGGKNYGVKTDAIGAIGGSAGGHLVALLGTSYQNASLEGGGGHTGVSSRVQAVVAAPVTYISKDSAPILFLHGDMDKTVPIAQSKEMLELCQKKGVRASLITVQGAHEVLGN